MAQDGDWLTDETAKPSMAKKGAAAKLCTCARPVIGSRPASLSLAVHPPAFSAATWSHTGRMRKISLQSRPPPPPILSRIHAAGQRKKKNASSARSTQEIGGAARRVAARLSLPPCRARGDAKIRCPASPRNNPARVSVRSGGSGSRLRLSDGSCVILSRFGGQIGEAGRSVGVGFIDGQEMTRPPLVCF
jgi:hypothetical protein